MTMTPAVRKLALTVHVTLSVGWIGALVAFLALAVVGLTSPDTQLVRAAYLAMAPITEIVIVPLALASLATGLVVSLGTEWGLLRHYWVLLSLLLTVVALAGLLLHTQPVGTVARAASEDVLGPGDLRGRRLQLVVASAVGLVVLVVVAGLNVFKPEGRTRYGWRKMREARGPDR